LKVTNLGNGSTRFDIKAPEGADGCVEFTESRQNIKRLEEMP
jgi:hypothetical protein